MILDMRGAGSRGELGRRWRGQNREQDAAAVIERLQQYSIVIKTQDYPNRSVPASKIFIRPQTHIFPDHFSESTG